MLARLRRSALLAVLACGPAAAQAPQGAPPAQERATFDILEFQVDGNQLLPSITIERAVYRFLGPGGDIGKVEKAREQLERAYHDAGYLTVVIDIPVQRVEDGVARLRVTEGRIERVRVTGQRFYSQGVIRESAPELAEGNVPYFPEVQDQLAQLNRAADRRVTPVLKPGTAPGTVQVDLNVEDRAPLHGSLELNNRNSADTTSLRLNGMLRYDNLWQRAHSLTFNFQTSPEDTSEVKVLSGSYLMPLWKDNMLALYAVDARSNVAAIGTLGVIGRGNIYGARAIAPLPSGDNFYHSVSFGLDYKNFKESVGLVGSDTLNTPISYAPFSVLYSGTAQDSTGITQLNLGLNFAVRGILGNDEAEFANKRFKAHANYLYLRGDVTRTQTLPAGFSLAARLDAQIASQPLISNEQFAAGGYDSVRGYLEAEVFGDNALRGSLELRAPNFPVASDAIRQFNLVAFYEGAKLRVLDPLPGQIQRFTISSAGIGLRLRAWSTLVLSLDVAHPFKTTTHTLAGDTVGRFRLAYEF